MDSCFTCNLYNNCPFQAEYGNQIGCREWKPQTSINTESKMKNLDIVKHNRELGLWLLENNFSEEIRSKIIEFINGAYELGFESGYSECKIVNFMDEENTQETYENNIDEELCPICNHKLHWTYEIKHNPKVGEDPRIYGVICSNCCYEKYDEE